MTYLDIVLKLKVVRVFVLFFEVFLTVICRYIILNCVVLWYLYRRRAKIYLTTHLGEIVLLFFEAEILVLA